MATASPKRVKSPKTPKTPSKKENISNSPSPRQSPNRNPSDVARKVRDCCASWHEHTQKWSKVKEVGLSVANKLVNLQLQKEYSAIDDTATLTASSTASVDHDSDIKLHDEIMNTSQELSRIYDSLADLCRKMESLEKNFNAIRNLKALQRKEDSSDDRIFSTWTIEELCDASKRLLDLYTKELSLKQRLVMEFTHCKNRDELMVYLSLWLHEPLLDDDNEVLLESMLIEAGLR
ncbi:cyclin-dependent kinase 2-interacting protein-like [Stylophora pistillata]|uniref:Cyclin-dependent kinase 2-interacting protein n=1 Tax=Stylophora pistillata TaxID=50429 RepID=A0A2B4RLE9_STYPI|nr:cyclin-dependent kinase 2-interacting protein-like [Stylophora pistillata]PFX17095.1 Cyclin-dependent kinase 2-interacting protein [Stylophora pistillata]